MSNQPRSFGTSGFHQFLAAATIVFGLISFSQPDICHHRPVPSTVNVDYAAAALSNDLAIGTASALAIFLLIRRVKPLP